MKVNSRLYSLQDIVGQEEPWLFNIPLYQRLYVWGGSQVLTLLEDICNAEARGEKVFFLGGTLLVKQEGGPGHRFDVVDGQQRFTTLWLLCKAWGHVLDEFLRAKVGDCVVPRLQFAIRPEVQRFLDTLSDSHGVPDLADAEGTRRMSDALKRMDSILQRIDPAQLQEQGRDAYRHRLAEFVFEKVKFVVTTVPRETDLNKLFEVINNRGVQLQHHEILKARLLDRLAESDRGSYAILWDACAGMDDYVEDNLCGISGLRKHVVTALHETQGRIRDPQAVRELLGQRQHGGHNARLLHDILREPAHANDGAPEAGAALPSAASGVRSMFGFPLFLQHVLRIWLCERGLQDLPRVLDRELLALFDKHFFTVATRPEDVCSFVDLLWRLRVLFDEHFIKWVDQGEEEVHLIASIRVTADTESGHRYMNRSREIDANRELAMLQSMLYHSQEITTQYWVTPLLLFAHRHADKDNKEIFRYLRHLDNHLLGSLDARSLVLRTRAFMAQPWLQLPLNHGDALQKAHGVKFGHYWFYKLEFVLWYEGRDTEPGWRDFRMTAKSSVEHISPQTPQEYDDNKVRTALDRFGNLALVSRSVNSEYGNLPFNEKRQRFLNRNKARLDSLKMDLIYRHERWSDDIALQHEQDMIRRMNDYCAAA